MIAIVSFIVILALSMTVHRVATVAFQLTGLSRDMARFHARSAFTGTGFTTQEAEQVVGHPVRRRITMNLMLVGNIGIVSMLGSLTLSVLTIDGHDHAWLAWLILAGSLLILLLVSRSAIIDRGMCRLIAWALDRWTDLDARDYADLLHLADGYGVVEVLVGEALQGRSVGCAALESDGVVVLGVQGSEGRYEGAPRRDRILCLGDVVWLYGSTRVIRAVATGGSSSHGSTE